mmetsp:Transcript_126805/g.364721  ORF Transcript_126805/g.364721 Transcript_126805/m.364721 type:complete len:273 (+) Transcript_126805:183-1001(+)
MWNPAARCTWHTKRRQMALSDPPAAAATRRRAAPPRRRLRGSRRPGEAHRRRCRGGCGNRLTSGFAGTPRLRLSSTSPATPACSSTTPPTWISPCSRVRRSLADPPISWGACPSTFGPPCSASWPPRRRSRNSAGCQSVSAKPSGTPSLGWEPPSGWPRRLCLHSRRRWLLGPRHGRARRSWSFRGLRSCTLSSAGCCRTCRLRWPGASTATPWATASSSSAAARPCAGCPTRTARATSSSWATRRSSSSPGDRRTWRSASRPSHHARAATV